MNAERYSPYKERHATVVGGGGKLGGQIVNRLGELGFGVVAVCEKRDRIRNYLDSSDFYFAVDADTAVKLLRKIKRFLGPEHTVLDGASVKTSGLIKMYGQLDHQGVSTATTHLGVPPHHPWEGAPVWISDGSANSKRAMNLAVELFAPRQAAIKIIPIEDHKKVEIAQSLTIMTNHILADALTQVGMTLDEFYQHSPLTAGLASLAFSRVLGQGADLSSEIVSEQEARKILIEAVRKSAKELKRAQRSRRNLRDWMQKNETFHNTDGVLEKIYQEAGVVAARRQNLELEHIRFTIPHNGPGELVKYLVHFAGLGMDLTAIDSMPVHIENGRSMRFDIGISPSSTDPEKMQMLRTILLNQGCLVE